MEKSKEDKDILIALKKAHSHLNNIIEMVEKNHYCINVLQQNLAVMGLLKSANNKLLARHLKSCFANAMKGTNEKRKQEMLQEILKINALNNK